jgi:hypothetical protein
MREPLAVDGEIIGAMGFVWEKFLFNGSISVPGMFENNIVSYVSTTWSMIFEVRVPVQDTLAIP